MIRYLFCTLLCVASIRAEQTEKKEGSSFFSKAKGALGKVKDSAEKSAKWVGDKAVETADEAVTAAGNVVDTVKENPLSLLDLNPMAAAKNFITKKGMELYKGRPTFLLEEGQKAFEKGDFLEAMKNFRSVLNCKEASTEQKVAASNGLFSIFCIFQDVTIESFESVAGCSDFDEAERGKAKKIVTILKNTKSDLN